MSARTGLPCPRKIQIDRSLGNVGGGSHVVHSNIVEAAAGKELLRRLHDGVTLLVFSAMSAPLVTRPPQQHRPLHTALCSDAAKSYRELTGQSMPSGRIRQLCGLLPPTSTYGGPVVAILKLLGFPRLAHERISPRNDAGIVDVGQRNIVKSSGRLRK